MLLTIILQLTLKTKLTKGEEAAQNSRLLIKSPVHTGRVKLLLDLFPNAQFIYIHRNPYQVFKSAVHMAGRQGIINDIAVDGS